MSNLPYSYHTFLFPFIWKNDESQTWEDFSKVLSVGTRWKETSWRKEEVLKEKTKEEWFQDYAAFQYFTEPANNVIFNTRGDNVVRCFEFLPNGNPLDQKMSSYIIQKYENVYHLQINKVRLQVYDIGIAILVFELENHEHKTLDDVNAINEYGRRINFPFLTPPGCQPLCADKISIYFNDKEHAFSEQTYNDALDKIEKGILTRKEISLSYVMKPIQKILDNDGQDNGGYTVTSNKGRETRKNVYIKPCVDDRMFVCCLIADNELSERLKGISLSETSYYHGLNERLIMTNGKVLDNERITHDDYMQGWADETYFSNMIYKFLFIETSLTCQDPHMKKTLLDNSIYSRWIQTGTLHGVTHHSMCCITNTNVELSVISPFLTQYVQIAILALAQRSAILLLSTEAAVVANGFSDDEYITPEQIVEIEALQAKYVKVQNQLLLSEITVQEQGIEIYEMFRQQLYIHQNKQELDEQMNNLRDVANISNERLERESDKKTEYTINTLGIVFGLLAIAEPIAMMIPNYGNGKIQGFWWLVISSTIILGGIAFVLKTQHQTPLSVLKSIWKKLKKDKNKK